MKKLLFSFFCLPVFIFFFYGAKASHVSGGDITYQCLGNNQYLITLDLFRDCSGIDMATSESLSIASSCSTMTVTATLVNPGGSEISQLCPSQMINSTCNAGTLPGMEEYTYQATITLVPCTNWVFSWATCCRNTTINVPTSSGDGSYLEATLNNTVDSCNISSVFLAQPIPSVCVNQPVVYNLSASNNDGDSLVFSFMSARTDAITPLIYTTPYSATNPINGISINSSTGTISFTPTTLGNFIVVVQIAEYNSQGILIGTIMRDIQFTVLSCTGNTAPNASSGTISGLTGSAIASGPYSLQLCSGGNFSFNIQVDDSNSTDTVFLTSNISSILPGATFTANNGNSASATISWTDNGAFSGTRSFVVYASDNICPTPGNQTFVYSVTILQGTFTSGNTVICGNEPAQLAASGGSAFQWTAISGDSIVIGTNFSCNPCANPIASPGITTAYVVTSNLTGGCSNTDTIVVSVVPDFSYSKTQSDTAVCLQEQVQFVVTATGTYTYLWSPSSFFNNSTINDPVASFGISGTQKVFFTITSASGCSKTDSMAVVVSSGASPDIVIIADTTICSGNSAQLQALVGNATPASCGLSSGGCQGTPSQITVGTGTGVLTNTSYPAPYGNWYYGARHQILFLASELTALGFSGGQISSLAFNVQAISGNILYPDFTIKMGCTNLTSITAFDTGLVTVFGPQNVSITTGWNTHTFSNGFDWDGISNIILEICFYNPNGYTNNSSTYYTTTSFPSVVWVNQDANPAICSVSTSSAFSPNNTYRPNVRFLTCNGGIGNSGYSYLWSPSAGLSNSSVSNPVATITADTTYTVYVVDTVGGCNSTASVNLHVVPDFTFTQSQSASAVCMQENVQFLVTPSSGTYSYQWTPAYFFNDSSIANPIGTFDSSGQQTVYFSISNSQGCNKNDSMSVLVSQNAKPYIIISGDSSVCMGNSTQLNANTSDSGFVFSWAPALGLSNAFISNPIATPLSDTTYTVIAIDTVGGCSDTASVFLDVVPDFTYTKTQSDSAVCLNEQIQFLVNPDNSSPPYSYVWDPGYFFNDSTIANPVATFNSPGTKKVYFIVSNSFGCDKADSMMVVVSATQKPEISIFADTTVCAGGTTQLEATIVNSAPSSCGLSSGGCQGAPSQINVGTGTGVLTNTTYPAPYGNWYYGVRHQILFLASELTALGFSGGQISSLALNVQAISGNTLYPDFTIKMGCTNLNSITAFQTGLVTVFGPQDISIITGWNTHTFSNGFNWDGISNIILEICFYNPSGYTNNSSTYYSTTSFPSVVWVNQDANPGICSENTSSAYSPNNTYRPNVRFSVCSGGGGSNGYAYSWSPSTGLNNASISNPVATISGNSAYTVIVTDTVGGCSDTASVSLNVVPNFTYTFSQSDSSVCENDTVLFSVSPNPPGSYLYDWNPSGLFNDTSAANPIGIFDSAGTFNVYFEVSNSGGCSKSDSGIVQVTASPVIIVSGDSNICLNETSQLLVSGGNSYSWTPSTGLNNPGISNPIAGPTSTTTYLITGTSANGCSGSASFVLTVYPLPTVYLGADTIFCNSATINAGSGFVSYLWSTGSISQSITVSSPGEYSVAVKDAMGCTNKDTINLFTDSNAVAQINNPPDTVCTTSSFIVLSATPGGGTWSGAGTTTNGIFSPGLAGLGPHDIIYSVFINNCLVKDTATITVDSCVVGTGELWNDDLGISIFPNPNNGKFVISGEKGWEQGKRIIVNTILGECIYHSEIILPESEIDLRNFGSGIYFLQISDVTGILTRKILIEK